MIPQSAFQTTAWQQIAEHLAQEIAKLREKNDGRLAIEETAHLRGQIKFAKDLLALGNPSAPIHREVPDHYTM